MNDNAQLETIFELARIQTASDWMVPAVICFALSCFVIFMCVADCVELGYRRAIFFATLRITALLVLLTIYLQPRFRSKKDIVRSSKTLVLADTSQSMLRSASGTDPSAGAETRIDAVVQAFADGELLGRLQQTHDVLVYRLDDGNRPTALAAYPAIQTKLPAATPDLNDADTERSKTLFQRSGGGLLFGLVGIAFFLLVPTPRRLLPMLALGVGATAVIASLISLAFLFGFSDRFDLLAVFDLHETPQQEALATPVETSAPDEADDDKSDAIDWATELEARGSKTQLGQGIAQLILQHRSEPIAGLVLLTDGANNAGLKPAAAAEIAAENDVRLFPIGLGSEKTPVRLRISDVAAPARAYEHDPFKITTYVQSWGLEGRNVLVTLRRLRSSEAGQEEAAAQAIGDSQDELVTLVKDGKTVAVEFEIAEDLPPGSYAYEVHIDAPREDTDASDNRQKFYVEVVDRRTKVLLFAGGPSREYRFLRNMLQRDKTVEVHVLLQSAVSAISQDADEILDEFPPLKEELNGFDCLIAIDPRWSALDERQVGWLETWVAEHAGGMIVIPSKVFAGGDIGSWVTDPSYQRLRALYPVEFANLLPEIGSDRNTASTPYPLEFTSEGIDAQFLWLDEDSAESQRLWAEFGGVYTCYPVRRAKAGATVYAQFGDPLFGSMNVDPVFLAGHFYGSGRVFYLGSSEMWRLRALDDSYFERFYTKLVRHVSQGRLQRGSERGDLLLLEKERYSLGENVEITANLKNAQREPLTVETILLYVTLPSGRNAEVIMKKDAVRPGFYRGDWTVRTEGEYRLDLPLAESEEPPLTQIIKVSSSAIENESPQRNDPLLKELADATGGQYYIGIPAALGKEGDTPLAQQLPDNTEITPVFGEPNQRWNTFWARWSMIAICGLLCLEWLTRRLLKLA